MVMGSLTTRSMTHLVQLLAENFEREFSSICNESVEVDVFK